MSKVELIDSPYKDEGRPGYECDVKITDSRGNSFVFFFAGNFDYYFIPIITNELDFKDYSNILTQRYIFDKEKSEVYYSFNNFLKKAKATDKYKENFDGDKFFWFSEDNPEDIANRLEITKLGDKILIDFVINLHSMSHGVRFTTSGSRNWAITKEVVALRKHFKNYLTEKKDNYLQAEEKEEITIEKAL